MTNLDSIGVAFSDDDLVRIAAALVILEGVDWYHVNKAKKALRDAQEWIKHCNGMEGGPLADPQNHKPTAGDRRTWDIARDQLEQVMPHLDARGWSHLVKAETYTAARMHGGTQSRVSITLEYVE